MKEQIVSKLDKTEAGSDQAGMHSTVPPAGLMHVEVDFPLEGLEEFHDWYNHEHLPERAGIPGFVTAERYAAIEGGPRWLALYEVESVAVLDSEAYCLFKGPSETAWTRRMLLPSRANFRRTIYELLWSDPGADGSVAAAGPAGLFSLRLTGDSPTGALLTADDPVLRALLSGPSLGRARFYRNVDDPAESLLLVNLDGIWAVQNQDFRTAWNRLRTSLVERSVDSVRGVQIRIM